MWHILWQTIKDRKVSLGVYCIAAAVFVWMYVALFPSMLEQAATFEEAFSNYPSELWAAFGIEELSFSTIEKFLAIEHFSLVWPIMILFLLISIAGNSLAGEVERGTAEIVLSRSVSRLRIFFGKYLMGIVALIVFTLFSVWSVVPLSQLHGVTYEPLNYVYISVLGLLFGWAVLGLAFMFSSFFSERSKAYMATGGTILIMYVLNIAATLKDSLSGLKWFSFFHYYDHSAALVERHISIEAILVFAGVALITAAIGAWWWRKRDIAI